MSELVQRARGRAEELMAAELPRRWRHVQCVAAKAANLCPVFGDAGDVLVAAAWLHDVGYATPVVDTGFHPLDGARYLQRCGEPFELCCLVANHSAATREAQLRGLEHLMVSFPDDCSPLRDAVWACDMTTSPVGDSVSFTDRLAEICERYPADHTVPAAITHNAGEIREAIGRTRELAESAGVDIDLRV